MLVSRLDDFYSLPPAEVNSFEVMRFDFFWNWMQSVEVEDATSLPYTKWIDWCRQSIYFASDEISHIIK